MNEVLGFIAYHPTPKIAIGGGVAYTVNSRDYKGVMIVVLSESNNPKSVDATGNANSRQ